jgi:hypothetical protein
MVVGLLAAAALGLAACGGDSAPAQASAPSAPFQSAEPASTPAPSATPTADVTVPQLEVLPTPTFQPLITRSEAESAVLAAVSACAAGVSGGGLQSEALRLFFESEYFPAHRAWEIEVTTSDFTVGFGRWRVNEGDLFAALPADRLADQIASSDFVCAFPAVLLEADPAPPRFVDVPPDPVAVDEEPIEEAPADETPLDIITSGDLASIRVWAGVYNCSQDFPSLSSFIARRDVGGVWLVEGRTPVTAYGLWEVDAASGEVRARDDRARQVESSCDASPVALSGEQASVRVWVATYDCFGSPPPLAAFEAAQESPHRWVGEGRTALIDSATGAMGATLFGLWLVESDTGALTGLDSTARNLRSQDCFQPFL